MPTFRVCLFHVFSSVWMCTWYPHRTFSHSSYCAARLLARLSVHLKINRTQRWGLYCILLLHEECNGQLSDFLLFLRNPLHGKWYKCTTDAQIACDVIYIALHKMDRAVREFSGNTKHDQRNLNSIWLCCMLIDFCVSALSDRLLNTTLRQRLAYVNVKFVPEIPILKYANRYSLIYTAIS